MGTYVSQVIDPIGPLDLNNNATIKQAGHEIKNDLDALRADIESKLMALASLAKKPPVPDYQSSVGPAPAAPDFAAMDAALAALRTQLGLDTLPSLTGLSEVAPFDPIITSIDVSFTDPVLPAAPTPELLFTETAYFSELLDAARAWLLNVIQNGGTGLAPDVEQQIWDRARDRTSQNLQAAQDKILADTAARGFSQPQGATIAALNDAFRMAQTEFSGTAREIAIKQADMAQQNTQFAVTQAGALETTLLQHFDASLTRALDLAKAGAQLLIDVFKTQMEGAQIAAGIQKTKADVAIAQAEVVVKGYEAAATKYSADVRLVEAETEYQTKTLGIFTQMYDSRMREIVARLDAEVRKYLGEYDTHKQEWALTIEAFRANVGLYQASIGEDGENKRTFATVWGALLSAVAHGLSVNYSLHASDQQQKSYSGRMNIDNNLTETYAQ